MMLFRRQSRVLRRYRLKFGTRDLEFRTNKYVNLHHQSVTTIANLTRGLLSA
jgi:hypothetical protein